MKGVLISGFVFVIMFAVFLISFKDGQWNMIACNVGQGDAFILQKGRFQILIDGGPSLERLVVCLERTLPIFDKHIEVVLVTHADHDHYGGFVGLVDYYSLGVIYHNINKDKGDINYNYFLRYIDNSLNRYTKYSKVTNKQKVLFEDGALQMYVNLNTSSQDLDNTSSNQQSIVSIFNSGITSILFTADSDALMLKDIIMKNNLFVVPYQNQIIVVPHHGSKSGLDLGLLNIIKPAYCVLSVGKNSYGHPNPMVLDLISSVKCKLLSTYGNKYVKVAL